ncbi:putative Bromodomain associated domain-containing protein [Seiridium cardinale]|uniref:Bromodomain associated domain-containing protein n=1 Tax=Seiridium cardinale TaxID=138064 RepID=A0ABR2XA55_9PEZI
MESHPTNPMTYKKFHLALLRPAILQILRAQGYYTCKPTVLEFFTEIVADYIFNTAVATRRAMEHNHPETPEVTLPDLRQGLEYMGAFNRDENKREDREYAGDSELRGIEQFKAWFDEKQNQRITRIAEAFAQTGLLLEAPPLEEGKKIERPPIDYLSQLKQKHSKNDDSRYASTILGKPSDHGEILVEGGPVSSIDEWRDMMFQRNERPREPTPDSRPPSSGLSSLDDGDVEMMDL